MNWVFHISPVLKFFLWLHKFGDYLSKYLLISWILIAFFEVGFGLVSVSKEFAIQFVRSHAVGS